MRFNADAEEEEPELSSDWQAEAQCHLVLARLRIRQKLWGGQSCPQPPFRRLFRAMSDFVARQGRLNAGCSQDWLPHNLCRIAMASKTKWHWAEASPIMHKAEPYATLKKDDGSGGIRKCRGAGRKALSGARHRTRTGRGHQRQWISARQWVRGHLGHRAPGRPGPAARDQSAMRSEERRVGKECRSRRSP